MIFITQAMLVLALVEAAILPTAYSLGVGYNSATKKTKDKCFADLSFSYAGSSQANLNLARTEDYTISTTDTSASAGSSTGGALLGVSGDFSVHQTINDKAKSFSFALEWNIQLKEQILKEYELSSLGEKILEDLPGRYQGRFWLWPPFVQSCGDQVIDRIIYGGKLSLTITVTSQEIIGSTTEIREYVVKVLFSKKKKSQTKTHHQHHQDLLIKIEARQIGGDSASFVERFGSQPICHTDDLEHCSNQLDNLIEYLRIDFPEQLKANPEVLDFSSKSYSEVSYVLL